MWIYISIPPQVFILAFECRYIDWMAELRERVLVLKSIEPYILFFNKIVIFDQVVGLLAKTLGYWNLDIVHLMGTEFKDFWGY